MWKTLEKYSLYEVSDKGFLRNKKTKKVLQSFDKDGYCVSRIKDNHGHYKCVKIHRLVAECYLENPKKLPMVNHKDEIKSNNFVGNLEWCDNTYNKTYSNGRPVMQFTLDGVLVRGFSSIREAERITGFNSTNISYACKKFYQTSQGFIWVYSDDVAKLPMQWLLLTI